MVGRGRKSANNFDSNLVAHFRLKKGEEESTWGRRHTKGQRGGTGQGKFLSIPTHKKGAH